MRYTKGFKSRMIQRMAGPEGIAANALSKEVDLSQAYVSGHGTPDLGPQQPRSDQISLTGLEARYGAARPSPRG